MLIIAVVVAVTIGITKAKLDNVVSYTYYNAYSTLRKISTEMLADWDPQDPEYKQALNNKNLFAFNVPKDYNFFSTFLSHVPFGLKIPTDRVRAGNTFTVYGCPSSAKYYSSVGNGASVKTDTSLSYYTKGGECLGMMMNSYKNSDTYLKCPGKYKGLATYAQRHAPGISEHEDYFCTYECSDLTFCSSFHQSPTGSCSCGLSGTDYYDVSCSGVKYMFSSKTSGSGDSAYISNKSISNAKVVSSTLTSGNVCKIQLECNDGYYWVSEASNSGYPTGSCKYCSKICTGGFTVDKSNCSCVCNKTCSTGYTLNKNTCMCVKDAGDGACNKTCTSGYTLDKAKCTCVKDKYTCWDGSKVDYSYQCPDKVTCWDGSVVHSQSECPACTNKPSVIPCGKTWNERTCTLSGYEKKCYGSGQVLDPNTCECYAPCWDGTRKEYSWQCPDKVTCWDGSYAHNKSECPACTKSCSEGYELNTSSCECIKKQVTCWDGSKADSASSCPGYVTCWNGNKAHNWSECPACPNKPACPASWDDKTCTGSAKTCPSGQHLNSSCGCVNDCPTDISPCNICSNETGIVSQNPAINRSCSDETYEWSEEQCKCIPSPRTLPRKGMNFCKLFERHANIMSGSDVCNGSVISNGTTDFSTKTPDITLRNGLRIYNMHNDAGAISMLANNTQGGVYDGVPNTNSYGYTVYVDIDGVKGDSQLWSDVYPFYITLSGKIIPAYDTSNPHQSGGDSVRHLQVSVENENYASGKRSIKWLAKSVPFKEGACIAGYVGDATPYCKNGTPFTKAGECTTNYNSMCRVKQIQPVKFFF